MKICKAMMEMGRQTYGGQMKLCKDMVDMGR